MATESFDLSTEEWTKVSEPGESGTCWKKTGGQVVIDHTDQTTAGTLPTSTDLVTIGGSKRVPLDRDSSDVLGIAAENANDIYYALAIDANQKIVTDMV